MKQVFVSVGCKGLGNLALVNSSALLERLRSACAIQNESFVSISADNSTKNTSLVDKKFLDDDMGAVFYIVAVLVFYSMCIVIMIITHLRRAKSELDDERVLEDFFRGMPQYIKEREQKKVNHFAIHAFHALTSLDIDNGNSNRDNNADYNDMCLETDELGGNSHDEVFIDNLNDKPCVEVAAVDAVIDELDDFNTVVNKSDSDLGFKQFEIQNDVTIHGNGDQEFVYATEEREKENISYSSRNASADTYEETEV